MTTLTEYALKQKYERVKKLRPNLEQMKELIDWNEFLKLFPDRKRLRGRPAYDRIVMVKTLFLQNWYGISDEEAEFQINDRLSFQQFLDYPETIPDYSTIWRFRERLTKEDLLDAIWEELNRQIEAHGIRVKKGSVQDATFIEADPGKKRSGMQGRGREAKSSRSKDGTWTKKNGRSHFGFKMHTKVDRATKLITKVAVTTASVHDSAIDLADSDDVLYRDKAYTGVKSRARGNASMKRGNLTPAEWWRNKRIQKKRCIGEHPFGTIKRSFGGGRTKLTTLGRVFVQQTFVAMGYNLHRLRFLVHGPS